MKRRIVLAVLLGVAMTATVEGHRHNLGAMPEALAASLGARNFEQGGNLFAAQGDLLLSSEFQRVVGPDDIAKALQQRYAGWTVELGQVQFWGAGEGADTANIGFVNWVYSVKKGTDSHKELFVAIARKKDSHDPRRETHNDQDWLFLTVRRLSLPLPH